MRMDLCFSMQSLDYERKEREFKNFWKIVATDFSIVIWNCANRLLLFEFRFMPFSS
jgi:hypothetical protein